MVDAYKLRWNDYRRALRRRDQEYFDSLMEYVDRHADASGYLNPDDPVTAILLSMHLEQQKRIEELESEVEELRSME